MRRLTLLLLCGIIVGCASSSPRTKQAQSGTTNVWWRLSGIPELRTVDQAVAYVLREDSVVNYKGIVYGSDEFNVILPSGRQISNWVIDCLFGTVFNPFGKKAIPALIDMLNHDYDYARLGAYYTLMNITGRYDKRYSFSATKVQRYAAVHAWKEWWSANKQNPRLDSRPNRVYEAEYWESQTIAPSFSR